MVFSVALPDSGSATQSGRHPEEKERPRGHLSTVLNSIQRPIQSLATKFVPVEMSYILIFSLHCNENPIYVFPEKEL
jgi:hypothetical protein